VPARCAGPSAIASLAVRGAVSAFSQPRNRPGTPQ
jgi:hypothetical protein